MSTAEGVSHDISKIDWKHHHQNDQMELGKLNGLAVSAISCEFSILQNSFKEQQSSALDDYIETSIMLQYHL